MGELQSSKGNTAIVVGSGLGGLLAGCLLQKHGWRVQVFEDLCFFGGKFTSFDYEGFQVPSGAFHCFPGGTHGQLFTILESLGIHLNVVESECAFTTRLGNSVYRSSTNMLKRGSYWSLLSPVEKLKVMRILVQLLRPGSLPDISVNEFLARGKSPERFNQFIDRFLTFSSGVGADSASIVDLARSFACQKGGREGVIVGGCRSVADSLIKLLESGGGELSCNAKVVTINVSDNGVCGVTLEDNSILHADLVVSNVGPKETFRLLGDHCPLELQDLSRRIIPAEGIAYSVRSDKPFTSCKTVEFPLESEHIAGYIEVSRFDSGLCPAGKHYLLAYQSLDPNMSVESEVEGGKAELLRLFPDISVGDIFNVSIYRGAFPAARTQQRLGQHGEYRVPLQVADVSNLYMLSHDSCGYGFAAEVIGGAAHQFEELLKGTLQHG